jgi:hypothetical protein
MKLRDALIIMSGLIVLPLGSNVAAQDLETQARALKVIRETAADICNTIAQEGGSQVVELSGDVKAKLGGAVAKIADLGVQGAGKYKSEEFRGPLHHELAAAIKDNATCRLEVLKLLQEKMLGTSKNPAQLKQSGQQADASVLCDERAGRPCGKYLARPDLICFQPTTLASLIQQTNVSECHFTVFVRSANVPDSWIFERASTVPVAEAKRAPACVGLSSATSPNSVDIRTAIRCQ